MTKLETKRVPIKEGFLTNLSQPLDQVRLEGKRCRSCGQAFLGEMPFCENCQSGDLESIVLSRRGKLYTYTILRNRPPGDYRGPHPFVPFAVGMVELPEGVRILSELTGCDIENIEVGMDLELVIEKLYEDEDGNEVMTYRFRPIQ